MLSFRYYLYLFTVFLYLKKSMTNENLQCNTLWR